MATKKTRRVRSEMEVEAEYLNAMYSDKSLWNKKNIIKDSEPPLRKR